MTNIKVTNSPKRNPGKGASLFALFAIAVCVFAGYYAYQFFSKVVLSSNARTDTQQDTKATEPVISQDTDGDGLADWQEELYGTNPKLVDSDGDRISDGEEVKNNHDPLFYGEGILVDETIIPPKQMFQDSEFAVLDVEEIQAGIDSSEENIPEVDPTVAELKKQINQAGRVVLDFPVTRQSDYEKFQVLFSREGSLDQDRIREVIANYQSIAIGIREVQVTPETALTFTRLAEGYQKTGIALQRVLDTFSDQDEQQYFNSLAAYAGEVANLQRAIYDVSAIIKSKQIVFSGSEPGSVFVGGI